MVKKILVASALISLTACAGVRTTEETYSAHAESVNILFMQFPGEDTQKRAMALVPEGADVKTINSAPKDMTSVIGFVNRLIGVDVTVVSGTIKK